MEGTQETQAVEYRDIPGFPGYRVGSDGSFWSRWFIGGQVSRLGEWRRMATPEDKGGCLHVLFRKDGKSHGRSAARMVLSIFDHDEPLTMRCGYRDGDKTNLAAVNLFWKPVGSVVGKVYRERNPRWKGDAVGKNGGRLRARRLYPLLGDCERCGKPATDRHHRDDNTANNEPHNVMILCRRCHMEVDGRLGRFVEAGASFRNKRTPRECVECGRLHKPSRRGLCSRCYDRKRQRQHRPECGVAYDVKEIE